MRNLDDITEDERKLTNDDILIMKKIFPKLVIRRFAFLSLLDQFIRAPNNRNPSLLEKVDYVLFKAVPPLRYFGSSAILIINTGDII